MTTIEPTQQDDVQNVTDEGMEDLVDSIKEILPWMLILSVVTIMVGIVSQMLRRSGLRDSIDSDDDEEEDEDDEGEDGEDYDDEEDYKDKETYKDKEIFHKIKKEEGIVYFKDEQTPTKEKDAKTREKELIKSEFD